MPYLRSMLANVLDLCVDVESVDSLNHLVDDHTSIRITKKSLTNVTEYVFNVVEEDVTLQFTLRAMNGPFSVFGIRVTKDKIVYNCYSIGSVMKNDKLNDSQLATISSIINQLIVMTVTKPWSVE